jgi:hypothetical protein
MSTLRHAILSAAALLLATHGLSAAAPTDLVAKGAKFTEAKNVLTSFELPDPSAFTDDDFKKLAQVTSLQKLSFGKGFNDHQLSLLTALPEVNAFVTNGAELTDEGVKMLAKFPKLQTVAFFHPGKSFTGTGLAALSGLNTFDNLTVGGTNTFGDEGVAAVAGLTKLKGLRIWHTNADQASIAKIAGLKNLTSLTIGQRLSNTPPLALSDETIPLVTSFKSLESLTFMEARLSPGALAQLKQLTHLKHLTLDNIDLTESEVQKLGQELPGVQIKFTAPNEAGKKRIQALFGAKK